jgi:ribosomal protein S27AE
MSLAIFILGVYIGSVFDSSSLSGLSDEVSTIETKVASVQLLLLSEGNSSSFCPVYHSELDSIDAEIEKVGHKLTFLEDERGVFDNDLKRKYFVLEAESYLLSKKVSGLCGDDSVLLIHFYSNKNCGRCRDQGTEILKARDALEGKVDVKLFSFDGELDSPVAEAFEAEFNVSGYPSVVIDERTYPGYRASDELQSLIKAAG